MPGSSVQNTSLALACPIRLGYRCERAGFGVWKGRFIPSRASLTDATAAQLPNI
jgi:hypothetical protein